MATLNTSEFYSRYAFQNQFSALHIITWPPCIPLLTHINYVRRSFWPSIHKHTEEAAKSAVRLLKCFKTSKVHADNLLIFKSEGTFHFHMVWCDDRETLSSLRSLRFLAGKRSRYQIRLHVLESQHCPGAPQLKISITFPSSVFKIPQTPQTLMKEPTHFCTTGFPSLLPLLTPHQASTKPVWWNISYP